MMRRVLSKTVTSVKTAGAGILVLSGITLVGIFSIATAVTLLTVFGAKIISFNWRH
jgi:hypothetical protein